jgi:hypothetical protein
MKGLPIIRKNGIGTGGTQIKVKRVIGTLFPRITF